jgi:hypothetical protein
VRSPLRLGVVGILVGVACTKPAPSAPKSAAYPLLDGHCDEYRELAQDRHTVAPGVELFVFQDHDYVWLCYTLPSGSLGTMDMILTAPALTEPQNLHVSAQLGEWPAAKPELAPDGPASDRWWNQHGWTALPVPFNGMTEDGKPKWRPTPGRELQLGKARFGRGAWKLRLQIHGLGEGGQPLNFPASGDLALRVW